MTQKIDHFSHQHPLFLLPDDSSRDEEAYCSGCELGIKGPFYGCNRCEYFLHRPCAELPSHIQHPSHPLHPLTLLALAPGTFHIFTCDACKESRRGFSFRCHHCDFDLDLSCAFPEFAQDHGLREPRIDHFSHYHPLTPWGMKGDEDLRCFGCRLPLRGPIYGCKPCVFFLHYSCLKLPSQIEHPFHPQHSLFLSEGSRSLGSVFCTACAQYRKGFLFFRCAECPIPFSLDVECAKLIPNIKFECHSQHFLVLLRYTGHFLECSACKKPCGAPLVRCVICDFNLHVQCGELPRTIKHKCHIDPLALTDSVVDDSDEFYCDACEKKRDPKDRVYYCAECDYVAHVECVMSEVLSSLERESLARQLEDVNLNTSTAGVKESSRRDVSVSLTLEGKDEMGAERMCDEESKSDDINATPPEDVFGATSDL